MRLHLHAFAILTSIVLFGNPIHAQSLPAEPIEGTDAVS